MTRTTPWLVAVVAVTLVGAALLAPVVTAQDSTPTPTPTPTSTPNATATPTPTPTATPDTTPTPPPTPTPVTGATPAPDARGDNWTLEELRQGGEHPSSAPPAVRYLPARSGAVALRYEPAAPFDNDVQFLRPNAVVHTNDLQLFSTRFGVAGEQRVALDTVFYQVRTRKGPNGTARDVAVNVRTRTYVMDLGYGYDVTNFTLPSHYDEPVQVMMQLEVGGEPVEGARWTFTHQTVQSEQAPPMAINSRGDLWRWAGINIFSVLIPGLLISAVGAKSIIRKTGRGPDKSVTWWALVVIAPACLIVATVGYFRTAQLAARLPQVFGGLAVLVAFITMLETMGRKRRTDEFIRDEFEEVEDTDTEEHPDRLYREKARVYTVKRDDGLGLLQEGIRPFLARLFADPAIVATDDLETDITITKGPDDHTYVADPESDTPLEWTPAHFELDLSLFTPASDAQGLVDRLRWRMVLGPLLGGVVGYYTGVALFDTGLVAALGGAAAALLLVAIRARDGEATFEPALAHYRTARVTIIALQNEFKKAKTIEQLRDRLDRVRTMTAREAAEIQEQRDKTVSQELVATELGVDPAELGEPEPEHDLRTNGHKDDTDEAAVAVEGDGEAEFQFGDERDGGADDA